MFDYVMRTGDAIGGDFIESRENDEIVIPSVEKVVVEWFLGGIEVAISEDSILEIEDFFSNKYSTKAENIDYLLSVIKRSGKYEMKSEVIVGDLNEEMLNEEFPKEIASKIIKAILGSNNDPSDDYKYDFVLTNHGYSEFTE